MYAACRAAVVSTVENELGLKIDRKVPTRRAPAAQSSVLTPRAQLEAASPDDIGEAQLLEEFHPKVEEKKTFQRPKRPGRR